MGRSNWWRCAHILLLSSGIATTLPELQAEAAPPFDDAGRAVTATPPAPPRALPPPPAGVIPPAVGDAQNGEASAPPERTVTKEERREMARSWGYSTHAPLRPRYVTPTATAQPGMVAMNPVGFYSGVSLRSQTAPGFAPTSPATATSGVLTWTGFERQAEAARVFFQVTGAVEYVVEPKGDAIEVRMRNVRPAARNNLRSLDLRFFETPIQEVELTTRGTDVVAKFLLKNPSDLDVALEERAGGIKMLVVTPRPKAAAVSVAQSQP